MAEANALQKVWLHVIPFYRYDPYYIINAHLKFVVCSKNYIHQDPIFYFAFRQVDSFDHVVCRMSCEMNLEHRQNLQIFKQNTYLYYLEQRSKIFGVPLDRLQ